LFYLLAFFLLIAEWDFEFWFAGVFYYLVCFPFDLSFSIYDFPFTIDGYKIVILCITIYNRPFN